MKIGNILKKNWIFVLFGILAILCFLKKDQSLPMDIVSYPDTQISLKNGEILEQTWLSEVKEITEVKVHVTAANSFENKLSLSVLDGETKDVLAESVQEVKMDEKEEKEVIFALPKWRCIQGNQYIFQLRFEEETKEARILLSAGTDYMGCSIDGVSQDVGTAIQITYEKNSKIFWIFISVFPLIAFSFLFMMVWNRKWEETVGMSIALLIFVLFLAGLVNQLKFGMGVLYVLSVIFLIWGIVLFNKKQKKLTDLFSVGIVIFVFMIGLILINNIDARFARWDEFSHWGLAAKDMFFSDSYAKHFNSTVLMKYYPPIMTLIEYFFCYTNELFSPSMVYVGFQVLSLCLLSVGLAGKNEKKVLATVTSFAVLFLIPIIIFYDVYNCIYVDPILAFGVTYVLICFYTEDMNRFNFLRIIGGLFILTLTKDTGVVLAGILTLVMLGDVIYQQWKEKKWNLKYIGIPLFCTTIVCVLFFVWQGYLSIPIEKELQKTSVNIEQQEVEKETELLELDGAIEKSGITLEGIWEIVTGDAPIYRYEVIRNYLTKIFSENTYTFGSISFSFMDIMFVLLGVSILISIRWKDNRIGAFGVLTFIGGMGYCGFLLVAYLFAFSEAEARLVLSFQRYAGSYVCGILIALFIKIIRLSQGREKKYETSIIILMMVLVSLPIQNFYITNTNTQLTDDQVYGFDDLANILQSGGKRGDKVYFVCNNSDGHAQLQLKSEVVPMNVNWGGYNIFSTKENYKKQMDIYLQSEIGEKGSPSFVSPEEWKEKLKQFEYVVLFHPNDVFAESYGDLFEDVETIGDGTVYRVENKENNLTLHYVGKKGIKSYR